jgi:hypothetical protein
VRFETPQYGGDFDVAPDGRFLMMREGAAPDAARPRIVHVQHWVEELKRLVPAR